LKDEKFNAVYCSDRGRAVETVLPFIEQDSKFPILFTPELQEKNIGSYA
jgi:broad specificity phosphatase PhoE